MEEDIVGAYDTKAIPVAPEPTTVPETVDNLDTGAYDFKEYDLKEYDLGGVDNRLYDYGAYDEYGTAPSKPTANYNDEVGPGVAAETDVSESTVSSTPWPCDWWVWAWTARTCQGLCVCYGLTLSSTARLPSWLLGNVSLTCWVWRFADVSLVCDWYFKDWQLWLEQCLHLCFLRKSLIDYFYWS